MRNASLTEIIFELVLPELGNTLYMLFLTTIFALVFGIIIALIMIYTDPQGLRPNRKVNLILEAIVDILMSMPFIILAVALIPFTRLIMGTCIGKTAALVPLIIATTPFIAKMIRDDLREVNGWTIEAAKSFGASDLRILYIMLKESVPNIVSGTTLSSIYTLGSTAMVGAVGAGGVGAVAIIYGYQMQNYKVIAVVVIVLIIFVQILQWAGDFSYKKLK